MAKSRSIKYLFSILALAIFFSCIILSASTNEGQMTTQVSNETCSHLADVSPSIYDWGIIGRPNMSEPFRVWANVTDEDFDLANVSVHVNGPNTTINEIMHYNGTFYVTDLDAFVEIGTYDIYVFAIDFANNTRTSRHVYIQIQTETSALLDPNITMPYVIVSSFSVGLIVCTIAYFYRQRQFASLG